MNNTHGVIYVLKSMILHFQNKPSKSLSSTVKKKFDVKLPSSGTESKSKIEERKEEKTPSAVVSKKTDKIGKKRSDLSGDKEAGEEKRSSLKRKVTGAGMFSFSWTRGSQRDTEQYRNGYPVSNVYCYLYYLQ